MIESIRERRSHLLGGRFRRRSCRTGRRGRREIVLGIYSIGRPRLSGLRGSSERRGGGCETERGGDRLVPVNRATSAMRHTGNGRETNFDGGDREGTILIRY